MSCVGLPLNCWSFSRFLEFIPVSGFLVWVCDCDHHRGRVRLGFDARTLKYNCLAISFLSPSLPPSKLERRIAWAFGMAERGSPAMCAEIASTALRLMQALGMNMRSRGCGNGTGNDSYIIIWAQGLQRLRSGLQGLQGSFFMVEVTEKVWVEEMRT